MIQEKVLPPPSPEEVSARGGAMVRACEHVIGMLGEDAGLRPIASEELKSLFAILDEAGKRDPFSPVVMDSAFIDWSRADAVGLLDIRRMLPKHETHMAAYVDTLVGMGVETLPRAVLVSAGKDRRLLESIEDDGIRNRILAARLQKLGSYAERKVYALALAVMAYQRE